MIKFIFYLNLMSMKKLLLFFVLFLSFVSNAQVAKQETDTLKYLIVRNNGIEYVGGGSARCMLAEIFLPKQEQVATELTLEAIYWFLKTNQAPLNTQGATDHVSPVFETVYENMLNTTV